MIDLYDVILDLKLHIQHHRRRARAYLYIIILIAMMLFIASSLGHIMIDQWLEKIKSIALIESSYVIKKNPETTSSRVISENVLGYVMVSGFLIWLFSYRWTS